MKVLKIETVITTFVIALIIQLFAEEIAYLAVYLKGNIVDTLLLSGIIIIIGLLLISKNR